MKCSTCGHENLDTARFCGACAASLAAAPACPGCGTPNPPGQHRDFDAIARVSPLRHRRG